MATKAHTDKQPRLTRWQLIAMFVAAVLGASVTVVVTSNSAGSSESNGLASSASAKVVVIVMVVSGTTEDYGEPQKARIGEAFAAQANVQSDAVAVTVTPASVRIRIDIAAANASAAAAVTSALATVVASTSAATSFLQQVVPATIVETVPTMQTADAPFSLDLPPPTAPPPPLTAPPPPPTAQPAPPERKKFEGNDPFAFLDLDPSPRSPVHSEDAVGGRVPHPDDPRAQVTIDETFTVEAGTEYLFDNLVVWVSPGSPADIEIYGTLRMRSSLLLWNQTQHQMTRLCIKDGGTLDISDSFAFTSNSFWLNWEYEGGSTIRLDHFVGTPWTTIKGRVDYTAKNSSTVKITLLDTPWTPLAGSSVRVDDAHHLWVEVFPPEDSAIDIRFPPLRTWVETWDLSNVWPCASAVFANSFLYERDVSLSVGNHVTVRDTPSGFKAGWVLQESQQGFFGTGQTEAACKLQGIGDPDNDHGVYYEHKTWAMPCTNSSLTVVNSKLDRIWPTLWDKINLTIRGSNLVDTRCGEGATYRIYDSTIDALEAKEGCLVYVENSQVRNDIIVKGSSTVYVYNVKSRQPQPTWQPDFRVLTTNGGSYVELDAAGSPF